MSGIITLAPLELTFEVQPPPQLVMEVEATFTEFVMELGPAYPLNPATQQVAAGAASYTHYQNIPADEWSVTHPLGTIPSGYVVMAGGVPIIPDFLEYSAVRVVLAFGYAETGSITLLKGS